ncbi:DUF498-domain-containing protein [Punctularia strigosozonata HHB-11173 SS5]|uniref:DUF498-domain-containing protein n=1 Tax=Punctularia strigosozonata (strain HHB-11173) TaxID=741275 RepID=UPI0004416B45|nr:DUF498-domain-containing protein [Punctularia strigosozonata HHB-11173 SS5]EIN10836.1 DUF498-domain-containing protein [Punctularia strigosozonata HHB-11173 SS5]
MIVRNLLRICRQTEACATLLRRGQQCRALHSTHPVRQPGLENILSGGPAPAVQVRTMTSNGIQLQDGLVIPGPCVFLEGKVLLWDIPQDLTKWTRERFEVFDIVVPKPEILLIGTGKTVAMPPPAIRQYLNEIGIQIDVMDTWNACSTYNLLAEEGRRVAAALLPNFPYNWKQ